MSAQAATLPEPMPARRLASAAGGLPRLLSGMRADTALTAQEHLALHGPLPHVRTGSRARKRQRAAALIAEIERAGLTGRGGASFPTALKLAAVADARGGAIVVVNAVEAEPASRKDRALLQALPHLVLDGAVLAAEALSADEAIIAVSESGAAGAVRMQTAISERGARAPGGEPPRLRVASVPNEYLAGQESALISFLGGGAAKPTYTPPLPSERGLHRRPTLVNNAETLAHLALIARHGAAWFRELGTDAQPGSTLVTLSGPVAHPGVYEIEPGATLASLIDAAGGAAGEGDPGALAGALLGGYAGTWLAGGQLAGLVLERRALAAHGASLGAGVIALLPEQSCPVRETARLARWLAGQSARQCGPCVNGLGTLADTLEQIAAGSASASPSARVARLASLTARRGACGHPDGTVNMILSALNAFGGQFEAHMLHGPCERCASAPALSLPHPSLLDRGRRPERRR